MRECLGFNHLHYMTMSHRTNAAHEQYLKSEIRSRIDV